MRSTRIAQIGLILWLFSGCQSSRDDTLRIIYTGGILGYLEPCGCREGRVGGLARLAGSVQDSLTRWKSSALLLDAGDFAETYGAGIEAKNRVILQAFALLHYDVINVTAQDLIAGIEMLRWAADSLKLPLISANLMQKGTGELIFPGWLVKKAGKRTVGVIGLGAVRPLEMRRARADALDFGDPETALRRALDQIRGRCDLTILLCDLTSRSSREMAARIPGIDLIISTMELTPTDKARKFGHAYVLGASRKGKMLTALTLQKDSADSLKVAFSRALLDSTAREDSRIVQLIKSHNKSNLFGQNP